MTETGTQPTTSVMTEHPNESWRRLPPGSAVGAAAAASQEHVRRMSRGSDEPLLYQQGGHGRNIRPISGVSTSEEGGVVPSVEYPTGPRSLESHASSSTAHAPHSNSHAWWTGPAAGAGAGAAVAKACRLSSPPDARTDVSSNQLSRITSAPTPIASPAPSIGSTPTVSQHHLPPVSPDQVEPQAATTSEPVSMPPTTTPQPISLQDQMATYNYRPSLTRPRGPRAPPKPPAAEVLSPGGHAASTKYSFLSPVVRRMRSLSPSSSPSPPPLSIGATDAEADDLASRAF